MNNGKQNKSRPGFRAVLTILPALLFQLNLACAQLHTPGNVVPGLRLPSDTARPELVYLSPSSTGSSQLRQFGIRRFGWCQDGSRMREYRTPNTEHRLGTTYRTPFSLPVLPASSGNRLASAAPDGPAKAPDMPRAYSYEKLGAFCKWEVQLEKAARMPVKFRLGEVQYVERMEGKLPDY